MAIDDFSQIAAPWLAELENDPERGAPSDIESTTFPLGGAELDGQAVRIDAMADSPPLSGTPDTSIEDIDAGRKAYQAVGIDALAFYKSFRFLDKPPFRGMWGIFLLDAGVAVVAAEFAAINSALPKSELRDLAVSTLLSHERYHFWIDAWALGQEVLRLPRRIKRYEYYLNAKNAVALTEDDLEESIANHYALRQLKGRRLTDGSMAQTLVRTFFQTCPVPYSTFSFNSELRAIREGELAFAVANGFSPLLARTAVARFGNRACGIPSPGIRPAPAMHPIVSRSSCPVFEVMTVGYAKRVTPFQGPSLKEFRQFLERYLAGQQEAMTDHPYYRIDNGEKVKFPNPHDKEVRGYELIGTLHKAGMTHGEFLKARAFTCYWTTNCPRHPPKSPRGH